MSESSRRADRLLSNLRAAGVPGSATDVERVVAEGHLDRVGEHVRSLRALEDDSEPDYVRAFRPYREEPLRTADGDSSGGGESEAGTIAYLAPRLEDGRISPAELTEQALARIAQRDPLLNAFQLVLEDRALAVARRAEAEIRAGEYRGPLHGVPIAVKDLVAMSGTVTTAGSTIRDRVSTDDAAAVERLEAAGAIIVGKTRLPEFAFWPGSTNPHFGPTANPRDPRRDAGGSSSGSGAAVADGMVIAALGSDTGGSIRIPAAVCGVVGLKPTFGRVSLFGCTSLAWSLDHLGPLTKSVRDAALVLEALSGADPRDARTAESRAFTVPDDLDEGVAGLRVGVSSWEGPTALPAEVRETWLDSLRALESAGSTLVEVGLPDATALRAATSLILSVEASTYHAEMLAQRYAEYGQPCRDRLLGGFAFSAEEFVTAQRVRRLVRRRWRALFGAVDLLSTPAQPDVAPRLGEPASTRFTSVFNALGWPAIVIPSGTGAGDLPLATQLVCQPWRESLLLKAGRVLESVG